MFLRPPGRTIAVVLLGVGVVVLAIVDPTRYRLTPPCPYLTLTGFACPGCGLTRSLHFLLRGHFADAFAYNPWAYVMAPGVGLFAALPRLTETAQAQRLRTALAWGGLALTLLFWVWRNSPVYPFLRL